ncbi:MAG: cohesin domain-containing protein [Bacillota bacterium]
MFHAFFSKNGNSRNGLKNSARKVGRRQERASCCIAQAAGAVMEGLEERQLLSTVSVPVDLNAERGETIHVPIMIDDASGLMSVGFSVTYDTNALDLSDADVVKGELLTGDWSVVANTNDAAGTSTFLAYTGSAGISTGSGTLFDLAFHVPQNAPTGLTTVTINGDLDEKPITAITSNVNVMDEAAVRLSLPTDLNARPGETVRVPVTLDNAAGLMGANLTITYDTRLLDLVNADVVKGALLTGDCQMIANVDDAAGKVQVGMFVGGLPLSGGSGTLFELVFHVPADAPSGTTALSFTQNELNEGELVVQASNGSLTVQGNSTLTISGDQGGTAQDDVIRLQLSETDSSKLNVYFGNSQTPTTYSLSGVSKIVVNGLAGNDRLQIDASHGMPAVSGGIVFNGGAGTDRVAIENTGSMSISASDTQLVFGTTPVTYAEVEGMGWEPGTGAALTLGGNLAVALDVSANLASLTLKDSAKLSLVQGSNTVLKVGSLSIGANATLDLGDNDLIVSATPETKQAVLAAVSGAIQSARGDGSWAGKGLTSSSAKAVAEALTGNTGLAAILNDAGGEAILNSFDGQTVGINDILVKYTWNGDVDLNGVVDGDDYFLIDAGFISKLDQYRNGDIDLNGVIDGDDYFLVDAAFISQGAPLAAVPGNASPANLVLQQLFSIKPVL